MCIRDSHLNKSILRQFLSRLLESLSMGIADLARSDQPLGLLAGRRQAQSEQMQIQTAFASHFFIKAELKSEQTCVVRAVERTTP